MLKRLTIRFLDKASGLLNLENRSTYLAKPRKPTHVAMRHKHVEIDVDTESAVLEIKNMQTQEVCSQNDEAIYIQVL